MKTTPPEESFDAAAVFYDIDYRDREDVEFWSRHIPLWGRRILEGACGTGRILEAVKRADGDAVLQLSGFDLSAAMVRAARRRTGLDTLHRADLREFSGVFPGPFDCVVIPFNSLMHLTAPEDWEQTFREVRRVLVRGGILAFSLLNPTTEEWDSGDAWIEEKTIEVCSTDNGLMPPSDCSDSCERQLYGKWYRKRVADHEPGVVSISFAFLPAGETPSGEPPGEGRSGDAGLPRVHFTFPLRYAYPSEVLLLLDRAGFELVNLWGGWDECPADEDSETLIFVARAG